MRFSLLPTHSRIRIGPGTASLLALIAATGPAASATPADLFLPEALYDYAETVLPPHFLSNTFARPTMQEGAAVFHDSAPADNPVTNAGATLGRVLFYDQRLSANGAVSCSSCHIQQHGFSDPRRLSVGFDGGSTRRHSMGLSNARFNRSGRYFWDERAETLEAQVLMPFQDPVEMGLTLGRLVEIVAAQPYYPALFEAAFGTPTIDSERISKALAQFVRSLVSAGSRYDQGRSQVQRPTDDFPNFTAQENRGKRIFLTTGGVMRTPCVLCHQSEAFVGGLPPRRTTTRTGATNNGLDSVSGDDRGLAETTMINRDSGRFRVGSLRNVGVTAPYMHDGRFATLGEVVDHYSTMIRNHPNLDGSLRQRDRDPERYEFGAAERAALVAFLHTLTDESFLSDPRFSDPFVDPDAVAISAVSSAAISGGVIAGQAWLTISGRNFSQSAGNWRGEPRAPAQLPLSVQGVSVSIGGIPAHVHSVSPTRITVLAPSDPFEGPAEVRLAGPDGRGAVAVAQRQQVAPALFTRDRRVSDWSSDPGSLLDSLVGSESATSDYLLAFHADGAPVAFAGALPETETRPARPGDTIDVFGTGFGATAPAVPDGHLVATPLPLASEPVIRFGEVRAGVVSSGLVAPGLYRITVIVPMVANGDIAVSAQVNGVRSEGIALLAVVR